MCLGGNNGNVISDIDFVYINICNNAEILITFHIFEVDAFGSFQFFKNGLFYNLFLLGSNIIGFDKAVYSDGDIFSNDGRVIFDIASENISICIVGIINFFDNSIAVRVLSSVFC